MHFASANMMAVRIKFGGSTSLLQKRADAFFSSEHDRDQCKYMSRENLCRRLLGSGDNFEIDFAQEHAAPGCVAAINLVTPQDGLLHRADASANLSVQNQSHGPENPSA